MGRHFSLATLMLVVAIAAIAAASSRAAVVDAWRGKSHEALELAFVGAVVGLLFGLGLAIWNRGSWIGTVGSLVGGICLGAAAGAQFAARVDWIVIFLAPIILIPVLLVVAANRRRKSERRVPLDPFRGI